MMVILTTTTSARPGWASSVLWFRRFSIAASALASFLLVGAAANTVLLDFEGVGEDQRVGNFFGVWLEDPARTSGSLLEVS